MTKRSLLGTAFTGLCSLGLALILWMLAVMLFEGRFRGYENVLWAGSLWLSAISSAMLVAYLRCADRPVLGPTSAFALFSIVYLACEGPLFGDVVNGGDPETTNVVVWNLIAVPIGVFVASEMGVWLGLRSRAHRCIRGQVLDRGGTTPAG